MGLFSLSIAGAGFIVIGAFESLTSSTNLQSTQSSASSSPPDHHITRFAFVQNQKDQSLVYVGTGFFAFLFIVESLISVLSAIDSKDSIGSTLQLQVIAIAALFLVYSVLGLVSQFSSSVLFPKPILELVLLFAFVEEFLLYYLQRKDTSGIENRYFDLLLVPISICVVSTVLELNSSSKSNDYARMARGVGLILQGTWFVQMGISFYSNMIVHGCSLHERSRGDYTIKCKGHPEYHRARGIATLQFNCHLALLVIMVVIAFSIMAKKDGDRYDFTRYKPLGSEMQQMENDGHFTLDSDEDEIQEEENVANKKLVRVEMGVNGNDSHK